jgi:hypothetical protein
LQEADFVCQSLGLARQAPARQCAQVANLRNILGLAARSTYGCCAVTPTGWISDEEIDATAEAAKYVLPGDTLKEEEVQCEHTRCSRNVNKTKSDIVLGRMNYIIIQYLLLFPISASVNISIDCGKTMREPNTARMLLDCIAVARITCKFRNGYICIFPLLKLFCGQNYTVFKELLTVMIWQ